MSGSKMADTDQDFALFRQEVRSDLRNIGTSIESIHKQLDAVVHMRDELTRMSANYEQWRSEKQTMWKKVDDLRTDLQEVREKDIVDLKKELHQWEGASKLARVFFSIALGVVVTLIGWTINEVRGISVMQEKIRVLELHDQQRINQK